MSRPWAARYVGIPWRERGRTYAGMDCWGLAREVWRREFGLEVPSYADDYATTEDLREVAALVDGHGLGWQPVPLEAARPGDAVLFRLAGHRAHVGVVVDPPWFPHVVSGANACLDRWDGARWNRRLDGVYRHASLVAADV